MELADGSGVMIVSFGAGELRAAALKEFPELASEVDEDAGSHLIVHALARAVMESVQTGRDARARDIVAFLDELLDRSDLHPGIPNAIALSFVEPESLQASTVGRRLWSEMPRRIRELVTGTEKPD